VFCAEHSSDEKLHEPGSTATWHISPPKEETQGWRHIRYTVPLVSFHRFQSLTKLPVFVIRIRISIMVPIQIRIWVRFRILLQVLQMIENQEKFDIYSKQGWRHIRYTILLVSFQQI
jgi:hypothetical protein